MMAMLRILGFLLLLYYVEGALEIERKKAWTAERDFPSDSRIAARPSGTWIISCRGEREGSPLAIRCSQSLSEYLSEESEEDDHYDCSQVLLNRFWQGWSLERCCTP